MALGLVQNATIAQGDSISTPIYVGNDMVVAITVPSTWVDNTPLTFRASIDGVTYLDMYDGAGNEISVVPNPVSGSSDLQGYSLVVPQGMISGLWLQIRSGPGALPVNQSDGATLAVTVRKFPFI